MCIYAYLYAYICVCIHIYAHIHIAFVIHNYLNSFKVYSLGFFLLKSIMSCLNNENSLSQISLAFYCLFLVIFHWLSQ